MSDNFKKLYDRATGSVLVTSMHLMPQWLTRLLEDCEKEADTDDRWPIKLLEKEARATIWSICMALGVESHGVPGQACRLVERFIAAYMRVHIRTPISPEDWTALKRAMALRLPLQMVSCVQLAAKMNRADIDLSAKVIRASMGCKRIILSVHEINKSEFEVFSMLGFQVPLWTSVEVGEALVVDAGMPQSMLEGVAIFVNLSEYRRDVLARCLRWAADIEPSCTKFRQASLRTLHLVAGSVVACARYVSFSGPDPAPRLAELTRAPLCYIRCISNVILSNIVVDDISSSLPQKRKNGQVSNDIGDDNLYNRKKQ